MQIPQVNRNDVLRVARRDFPLEPTLAIKILDEYENTGGGERLCARAQLAALKLSEGNIEELRRYVKMASHDYRDVIAPAEWPRFWHVGFTGVWGMTEAEKKQLQDADFSDYQAWLKCE